jgi:hypothetical protein
MKVSRFEKREKRNGFLGGLNKTQLKTTLKILSYVAVIRVRFVRFAACLYATNHTNLTQK